MNDFPIYPASSLFQASLSTDGSQVATSKYPWRSLAPLQTFGIPVTVNQDGSTTPSFRTIKDSCYRWSKKLGYKFRCVYHEAERIIEVGRLADPQAPEKNAPAASSANPRPIPAATIRQPEDDPLSWLNKPLTDQPAATVHASWGDSYKPVEDKPSVGTDRPFVAPWVRDDK